MKKPHIIKTQKVLKAAAVLVLIFSASFLILFTLGHPAKIGLLESDQTFSGENLSHSLDLRLAKKASYPSSALDVVNNLGSGGGTTRQVVRFAVKTDQLSEYALLIKPASPPPAKGYPTIILCHGYVNPSDYHTDDGYVPDMEFYAQHGFLVVKPDYRGQGLSANQGIPEGAYYSMAYNIDVMSLISALKDTSYIDKTNINIWGHSMGGYIALRAAVVSPDIKNAIILDGPVGSLKQIYLAYVPQSDENNEFALRIRNEVFAKYGTPGEGSTFWANASPNTFLSQTKAYFQIHVGSEDTVVPPELSKDLDAALNTANKPHQYFVYPDGHHSLSSLRADIWSRSLELLQKS